MLGLEDIVCCGRDHYEEEMRHYRPYSPSERADLYWKCIMVPPISHDYRCAFPVSMSVFDGSEPAQESTLEKDKDKYARPQADRTLSELEARAYSLLGIFSFQPLTYNIRPMQDKLSALNDWATAICASHASGVVHGNLTQESVGIVHGKGMLINQERSPDRWLSRTREALEEEDDIYGARWAATELFRLDNDPRPTKMSDVYSFACLMLQMLTGSVPYCGTKRPEQVVYLKYLGREPIDAQTPKVADRYVAFMRWCWSPEPENRPTMDTVVGFIHEEIKRLGK